MLTLYRFNETTGYWVRERECDELTAESWYRLYAADEPEAFFYISRRKPKHNPVPTTI
jgi:hypothetical protein